MQLEALFDKYLPSSSKEFSRVQIIEAHAEILSRITENSLSRKIGHKLPPFCRVVACPSHLLNVHLAMFKIYLEKYRENKDEDTRLRLMDTLSVIFHTDKGGELFANLSEHERIDLNDAWIVPMMEYAQGGDEFARHALLQLFTATTDQQYLCKRFEYLRTAHNFPTSVYARCNESWRFRNVLAEIDTSVPVH